MGCWKELRFLGSNMHYISDYVQSSPFLSFRDVLCWIDDFLYLVTCEVDSMKSLQASFCLARRNDSSESLRK